MANGKHKIPEVEQSKKGLSPAETIWLAGATRATGDLADTLSESSAIRTQRRFRTDAFRFNASVARRAAKDALDRGTERAQRFSENVAKVVSAQKAHFAAQDIVVDSGTARELEEETLSIGAEERSKIRLNSIREAYGFEKEAIELESQARLTRELGKIEEQSRQTIGLLDTAISLGSSAAAASQTGGAE